MDDFSKNVSLKRNQEYQTQELPVPITVEKITSNQQNDILKLYGSDKSSVCLQKEHYYRKKYPKNTRGK
jgi:hypothetical protein